MAEWKSISPKPVSLGSRRYFLSGADDRLNVWSLTSPQCPVLAHSRPTRRKLDSRGPPFWEVAMGQPDLFRMPRKPWNAGRMTGAKAPLKPKHIWAIRQHLKSLGSVRDLAMFNTALDAKLRGCDLVKLRLADVAHGGVIRQRSTIVQQKTGRPRTVRDHRAGKRSSDTMARPPRPAAG